MRSRLNRRAAVKRATSASIWRHKIDCKCRLLRLLHVFIVGQRQSFQLQRDGLRRAVDAAHFGADQLRQVGILLLRHGARSGRKRLRQNDKSKLRRREKRDLFGKPAQVQPNKSQRLQILENEVAIAGGVHGVRRRRRESQLARSNRAVERKRCAGHRTRTQRAIVQPRRAILAGATASRRIIST